MSQPVFAYKVTKADQRDFNIMIEGIKSDLKDPDSAKFRNVFISMYKGKPTLCGELNAKNSFGAYTGYKRFLMIFTDVPFEMWLEHCRDKISDFKVK